MIDRESAYEILSERIEQTLREKEEIKVQKEEAVRQKEDERLQKAQDTAARAAQREKDRIAREKKRAYDQSMVGSLSKMAQTKVKRELVNTTFKMGRGLLGSLLKGK